MTKRILVTGVTGFTGGHLCRRLVQEGHQVRALVRDVMQAQGLGLDGVEFVEGDLRDREAVFCAVRDMEIVYHIAALFRPENVTRDDICGVNLEGTRNMLDAAVEAQVERFVHCSTIGVHGDVKVMPGTESTPYNPGDYYQESKTDGEKLAIEYMNKGDIPISIFRPGGIYGPGDLRFLKLFKQIKNGQFIMFGSGEIMYQVIYIDDLVDGIILCGEHEDAVGEVFILTGAQPTTLNKLVAAVADVVGAKPSRFRLPVMPLYYLGWGM